VAIHTISPPRQRMIEDMKARKLYADTQRDRISSRKRGLGFLDMYRTLYLAPNHEIRTGLFVQTTGTSSLSTWASRTIEPRLKGNARESAVRLVNRGGLAALHCKQRQNHLA
jgi:hypothetical protein